MTKVVVLVSGGGTNLQAILDKMDSGAVTNVTVEAVISNRADAYALERARNRGIAAECISPKSFASRAEFNEALLAGISKYEPDLIVLAGYLVILPASLIEAYPRKILNIHPSLIPSFCGDGFYGLHVHEAVLARGSKVTGATVHFVDEGTDTGPILLQKAVAVKMGDTPEVLQRRVMEEAEWELLPAAINAIANGKVVWQDGRAFVTE
ncbi:MAG: phosphoribosylglycinamide formyltransferase [Lachnospiraceae bacterium]|nr:phosphoribosylglycinamide formyltransferase [Lachnospiraceae bacterium]